MKIKKIVFIILIALLLILIGQNISNAAYSAEDKTVNSGESFSVGCPKQEIAQNK